MPDCEHCGEHYPRGGAYSTHVRYCEGGQSESDSEDGESPAPDSGDAQAASQAENEPAIAFDTEAEYQDVLERVRSEAYAEGYGEGEKVGYDTGHKDGLREARVDAPEPEDTGGCCSTPSVAPPQYDQYRTTEGTIVEMEKGDRICVNCGEIHEAAA